MSASGAVYRFANKIHAVPGGHVACCGDSGMASKFVKWLRGGQQGDLDIASDDMGALSIIKGEVLLWDGSSPTPCDPAEKLAIGCGMFWALAALDFGKTAAEAVAYAATRDNGTGGGVDTVVPKRGKR